MGLILLVEDEPFNQAVIQDVFEFDEIPAELACADSGEEALEKASQLHPMLILMDVGLPGIDGLEATRRLKADPQTAEIPVWALTAHAMKGDGHKALEAGCSAYFTKPINVKEFSDHLREYLTEQIAIGESTCQNS